MICCSRCDDECAAKRSSSLRPSTRSCSTRFRGYLPTVIIDEASTVPASLACLAAGSVVDNREIGEPSRYSHPMTTAPSGAGGLECRTPPSDTE